MKLSVATLSTACAVKVHDQPAWQNEDGKTTGQFITLPESQYVSEETNGAIKTEMEAFAKLDKNAPVSQPCEKNDLTQSQQKWCGDFAKPGWANYFQTLKNEAITASGTQNTCMAQNIIVASCPGKGDAINKEKLCKDIEDHDVDGKTFSQKYLMNSDFPKMASSWASYVERVNANNRVNTESVMLKLVPKVTGAAFVVAHLKGCDISSNDKLGNFCN